MALTVEANVPARHREGDNRRVRRRRTGLVVTAPIVDATAGGVFQANGTLTTTIDGQVYSQPANGT